MADNETAVSEKSEQLPRTSLRRSTFVELGNEQPENVIYVEDRPLRRLLRQSLAVAGAAVLILATIGFFMGFVGAKTPHIGDGVISNQFSKITGEDTSSSEWNELEKNR